MDAVLLANSRALAADLGLPWIEPGPDEIQRVQLTSDGALLYDCPGCRFLHGVHVNKGHKGSPVWTWNGSLTQPTLSPSVHQLKFMDVPSCHHFIKDGKIQFLHDCEHPLKGQTILMPQWES